MIYLVPSGNYYNDKQGILVSPSMRGIPLGISNGMKWAADNEAFTKPFIPDKYFPWLNDLKPYKKNCLFVVCPDVVGDARKTIDSFYKWISYFEGWPVAFVAQDGQEDLDFPETSLWDCLFIGGTTKWKMSNYAIDCIGEAQNLNKHIHIGRVNYFRRYQHFASLSESDKFTCDGTRIRYERDKTLNAWKKYMDSPKQYSFYLPNGNSDS